MSTQLKISHTILYAKKWYKRNNKRYGINPYSICWEDIIKTLRADGYYPTDKSDCIRIIDHIIYVSRIRPISHLEFLDAISPYRCASYGYVTKEYAYVDEKDRELLPPYNQADAIMYYYLSVMSSLETKYWIVKPPKKGVLPFKHRKGRGKMKGWLLDFFGEEMPQYKEAIEKNK